MKLPCALLSLAFTGLSFAATSVVSNTGNTASTGTSMGASYMMTPMGPPPMPPMIMITGSAAATSFTTSGSSLTIDSATLLVSNAGSGSSIFNLAIFTDNAGAPGTQLTSFTPSSGLVTGENTFSAPAGGYLLEASTTYWLVGQLQAVPMSSNNVTLADTADLSEASGAGWTIGTKLTQTNAGAMHTTWNSDTTRALQFSLNAVPEPASAALVMLSGGLLLRRQRRAA